MPVNPRNFHTDIYRSSVYHQTVIENAGSVLIDFFQQLLLFHFFDKALLILLIHKDSGISPCLREEITSPHFAYVLPFFRP